MIRITILLLSLQLFLFGITAPGMNSKVEPFNIMQDKVMNDLNLKIDRLYSLKKCVLNINNSNEIKKFKNNFVFDLESESYKDSLNKYKYKLLFNCFKQGN